MNRPRQSMILFAMALTLIAPQAIIAADPAQDIYARYADSVVTITTYDECLFPREQGSGVIIKTDKENIDVTKTGSFILTNYHVILRPGRIIVTTKAGNDMEATICYFDEASDTALLHIREYVVCAVPNPTRSVDIGSAVFAIGTPKSLGWTISNGIVSSVRNKKGMELVQFTASVSEGSSGGPLFTAKGEMLGITTFKIRDSENLNFAVRIKPQSLSQLERHYWQGALPLMIDNEGWCVGQFQEKEDWKADSEKAKTWDAHSNLIANLEKKYLSASHKDGRAATEELVDANRFGRRPTLPLNVLQSRVDQAYASRFEDFPEDYEGWVRAANLETNPSAIARLMRLGLQKWPRRRDVYSTVFYYFSSEDAEASMKFIEKLADALPSREDVTSLPSDASYALSDASLNLNQLIKDIRLFCDVTGGGNDGSEDKFSERVAGVRRALTSKGWQETSKKTPLKDTESKGNQLNDLKERAEQGDAVSQFNLGYAYQTGKGIPVDAKKAVEWYRKAANQGNLGAQFLLGFMYRTGEGVKTDYAEALRWYQKAAEAGSGAAQSELGMMYQHGLGIPVDYKQAAQWNTKAVERGWGYCNLGSLYENGRGVPQDDRKAVELYRRGAETGDGCSQSNLGVMYATGRGVTRDDVEAYKWFTIPMKKGDKDAKTNRELMDKRMTEKQIAEGERRAAIFVPKDNPARHKLPSR